MFFLCVFYLLYVHRYSDSVCFCVCVLPHYATCRQERQQQPADHAMIDSCQTALVSFFAPMIDGFRPTVVHVEKLKQNVQPEI